MQPLPLPPPRPPQVSSAFSQLLCLHNVTEEAITARVEKAARLGEVEAATRSTNKSLQRLVNKKQVGRAGGGRGGQAGWVGGGTGRGA